MNRQRRGKGGFTIVELLTVMGVIALLIGLLVPALNMVKDYSREIQQKAQFHSIDVGLEMFKNDFGVYPESDENSYRVPVHPIDPTIYGGAAKLAEAMVGQDLLGFHPKSGFTASGMNDLDGVGVGAGAVQIYDPINGINVPGVYVETGSQNIDVRKKYIDLEHANAYRIDDIYVNWGAFNRFNFLLCDVYAKKRQSGKKTGMPILYYRARTAYKFQDYTRNEFGGSDQNPAQNDDIYNYWDNERLLALGDPEQGTAVLHPLRTGTTLTDLQRFEEMILNKQVQTATRTTSFPDGIKRPYRAESYILISAGKDGLYGTADDVLNIEKGKE
ncbi:MAG: type II secretion system protein [Anaerohalosphaeraceae bacterium]